MVLHSSPAGMATVSTTKRQRLSLVLRSPLLIFGGLSADWTPVQAAMPPHGYGNKSRVTSPWEVSHGSTPVLQQKDNVLGMGVTPSGWRTSQEVLPPELLPLTEPRPSHNCSRRPTILRSHFGKVFKETGALSKVDKAQAYLCGCGVHQMAKSTALQYSEKRQTWKNHVHGFSLPQKLQGQEFHAHGWSTHLSAWYCIEARNHETN
jgi:hypothetical protein